MKRLSNWASALLNRLHSRQGILARLRDDDAERVHLIKQVAECRELPAVLPLTYFLFDRSSRVVESAADAIHQLLVGAAPEDLLALEEQLHRMDPGPLPTQWHRLRPEGLLALGKTVGPRTSVIGLASFHPSGYVREMAIYLLAKVTDGSELPFLLLRLNDWVAAVRQAASEVVGRRLREGPLDPFLRNLGLVFRLTECRRADHAEFVEAVVLLLTEPEHGAALSEVIRSSPRPLARPCFRLAAQLPGPHLPRLIDTALRTDDAVLRLWATRHLPATMTDRPLEEVLSRLERDRSMPVRREALAIRLRALPESAIPALQKGLVDPNPAVREFSRFHLGRLGWEGFAAHYRDALKVEVHRAEAIAGLGETGDKEDAERLVPFLTASDRKQRQAAVRAVGKLAGDENSDLLVSRLTDESTKVVREAEKALQGSDVLLDPERLWAIYVRDRRRPVRLAVLALLEKVGAWGGLPYLIRAAADPEGSVARRAMNSVRRRYYRVFTKPTEEERRRIDAALEECAGALDEQFLRCLHYQFGG